MCSRTSAREAQPVSNMACTSWPCICCQYLVTPSTPPPMAERAAHQHGVGAQGQHLEHVHAVTHGAVGQDGDLAAHGIGDGGQHGGGAGAVVQHAAAVVGDHDGVAAGVDGAMGVVGGHDALDDELAAHVMHIAHHGLQFRHGHGHDRAAHLAQGDETGGVHVHAQDGAAVGQHAVDLFEQFLAFPGLDEGDAVAVAGLQGLDGGVDDEGRHAVTGTADDTGGAAAFQDGEDVVVFAHGIAHVERDAADGGRHDGEAQVDAQDGAVGAGLAGVVQGRHVEFAGIEGFAVVAEAGTGAQAAHAGHFTGAGLAIANGADAAVTLHALARGSSDLFHGMTPL